MTEISEAGNLIIGPRLPNQPPCNYLVLHVEEMDTNGDGKRCHLSLRRSGT